MPANVLEVCGLSKRFGGVQALDSLDIVFPDSGVIGIVGPNGAGKSTLLNVISGFVRPDGGTVAYRGHELTRLSSSRIGKLGIVRTFQDMRLISDMKVRDMLRWVALRRDGILSLSGLLGLGMHSCDAELPCDLRSMLDGIVPLKLLDSRIGNLSFGEQKLVLLGCCVIARAEVMLLDEPIGGVHASIVQRIADALRSFAGGGKLVLFVEHDMTFVREIADVVVVMDAGKTLAMGSPLEVLGSSKVVSAFLG